MTTRPAANTGAGPGAWADDDAFEIAVAGTVTRGPELIAAVGCVRQVGARAGALLGLDVLVPGAVPCGECEFCRRGGAPVCPHSVPLLAVGRRLRAHQRWATRLDDSLGAPALRGGPGALAAGPGALAYTMYARANISPRDATIVIGDDVVAHLLIDVLVAKGAPPVVVARAGADRPGTVAARARALGLPWISIDDLGVGLAGALAQADVGQRPRRIFVTGDQPIDATLIEPLTTLVSSAARPQVDAVALARLAACEGLLRVTRRAQPDLLLDVAALVQRGELDVAGAMAMPQLGAEWQLHLPAGDPDAPD